MVPLADMFKHAAPSNLQVESDMEVCLQCGSNEHIECHVVSANGNIPPNTVDIRTIEPLDAGEEALNSYGELGNAELLCQYGFISDTKSGWERCSWDIRLPSEREELCSCLGCDPAALDNVEQVRSLEPIYAAQMQRDLCDDGLAPAYTDEDGLAHDFAPISQKNRHDQLCPLFVDAVGRVSWPLWRLALGLENQICSRIHPLDSHLAHWHADRSVSLTPRVKTACERIVQLCQVRLEQLRVFHEDQSIDPPSSTSDALHFAVQHAWQDMSILQACQGRYDTGCTDVGGLST